MYTKDDLDQLKKEWKRNPRRKGVTGPSLQRDSPFFIL